MADIKFARASADDLERLVALRLEVLRPSLEAIGRFDPARARKRFTDEFEPEHTRLILENGKLIGCFALMPREKHLYLGHFYVALSHQRKGIGQMVMANIIGAADALNQPIKLIVIEGSPAYDFYQKLGFKMTGTEGVDIHMERKPSANS
jgi:GNAT superfamily N-acetyltransferase